MFGWITSPDYLKDIQEAVSEQQVLFEKVGPFNPDQMIQHCQAAASLSLDVFIVDIESSTDEAILKGIRQFRMKNNARIILLAPGRIPGDPTILQLVNVAVWDIIAPTLPDEEEDPLEEINIVDLAPYIIDQLNMNYSYGNAARWNVQQDHLSYQQDGNTNKKETPVKKKKEKWVDDNDLFDELFEYKIPKPKEKIVIQDRIVGTVTIAIGATGRRTGCTHSALQVARFLRQEGFKTACVELVDTDINPLVFHCLQTHLPSQEVQGGFNLENTDFFPHADLDKYIQVVSSTYEYVVVDAGPIVRLEDKEYFLTTYGKEFIRTDFQMLSATAAVWDVSHIVNTLDAFYRWNWNKTWHILINLADDRTFKDVSTMFSAKEKQKLMLSFYQNRFQSDPFIVSEELGEIFRTMLRPVLPSKHHKKKKKKLFF